MRQIRRELQEVKASFEGAVFDAMTTAGPPRSLYAVRQPDEIPEPDQLAKYLNPTVKGQYDRLQDVPERPSEPDLLRLYYESIKTAFQIGMLAGAIFADCPKETLDRFERGLAFATAARHWQIKE